MMKFKICPHCEGRTRILDTTYDRTGVWQDCKPCYTTGLEIPFSFVVKAVRAKLSEDQKETVKRPDTCRNEQQARGDIYPRSGCDYCHNAGLFGCPFDRAET